MTVNFNDYFWGQKNNGYEVLYHNMKYGLTASKELAEFFREKSNLEEHNSKLMSKLANKAGSGCTQGTFAPIWVVLKGSAERLSTLHMQMVQKITELMKDVTKYAEDVQKKHKSVKEEEAGTIEAVHAMQSSTIAVQKAKDNYTSKLQEVEKLRKDNASAKDIEKAETKLRKQQDDYKALIEKHNPIKIEFERRMTQTCRRFQEIEEAHLRQMREFLSTYIELLQSNHDMIGQVHSEFKRQYIEMTVDHLLEQFVLSKYTGLEKPELLDVDFPKLPSGSPKLGGPSTASTVNQNESSNLQESVNEDLTGLGLSINSSAGASGSVTSPAVATKKEGGILNWFTSSSSAANKSAAASSNSITNGNEIVNDLSYASPQQSVNSTTEGGHSTTPPPPAGSSKMSKTKNGNSNDSQNIEQNHQQPVQQQQKSSRRTTSLLNLFMSNSQGSRESRESSSIEAISAPTSPHDPNQMDSNTSIGRNPLRGSKFSGFLRSRRDKAKTKKSKKKKDGEPGGRDDPTSDVEEKEEIPVKSESPAIPPTARVTPVASLALPEVDEDGYSKQPAKPMWENQKPEDKPGFDSDSDSDSDTEERGRKIHVEIKPLNNGTAPISASVDELRATVENLSLSPLGALSIRRDSMCEPSMKRSYSVSQQIGDKPSDDLLGLNLFQQHQSPGVSNSSTPTTTHPYAPLQSPTLSATVNSRYADLGDIFSEVGEISASAPASATYGRTGRQIPTPTSGNSIAIPRPPSRRSEAAVRGRISPLSMSRADSVNSLEFRTASMAIGSSRGPSPLTIGMNDIVPIAVAFSEIIHAFFKGSDETKCQVRLTGEMKLSFPAGIVNVLANNPNPAKLSFRIKNIQNLDNIIPNKQLVTIDKLQSTSFSNLIEFNMPALTSLLRSQSEQNPTAAFFNVDILKYQVKSKSGASSCPFQLVSYWKCEPTHTDIKIDYKYNSHAMTTASSLLNVAISVPVNGGVRNFQSRPHSAWLGESNRLVWNFTDISQNSDNNGVGTLRARLEVNNGPSVPSILSVQFNCEGTTLSGIEFELNGPGYRLSLLKKRFISGKYICEGDGIRSSNVTPTPQSVG